LPPDIGPGGGRAGEGGASKQRGLGTAGPEGMVRGRAGRKRKLRPAFTGLYRPLYPR